MASTQHHSDTMLDWRPESFQAKTPSNTRCCNYDLYLGSTHIKTNCPRGQLDPQKPSGAAPALQRPYAWPTPPWIPRVSFAWPACRDVEFLGAVHRPQTCPMFSWCWGQAHVDSWFIHGFQSLHICMLCLGLVCRFQSQVRTSCWRSRVWLVEKVQTMMTRHDYS